jgi:hypothetical protein
VKSRVEVKFPLLDLEGRVREFREDEKNEK